MADSQGTPHSHGFAAGTPPHHEFAAGTPPHHGYSLGSSPHHPHRGSHQHRYGDPSHQRHEMYSLESGSTTGYVSSHHGTVVDHPRSSQSIMLDDKDFQDNLPMAVFTMLCCCWPLGILSFLNARDARRFYREGRLGHAYESAHESKRFSVWSFGVGIVVFVLLIMTVIIVLSYTLR